MAALHIVEALEVVHSGWFLGLFGVSLARDAFGELEHVRTALGFIEIGVLEATEPADHFRDAFGATLCKLFDDAPSGKLGLTNAATHRA